MAGHVKAKMAEIFGENCIFLCYLVEFIPKLADFSQKNGRFLPKFDSVSNLKVAGQLGQVKCKLTHIFSGRNPALSLLNKPIFCFLMFNIISTNPPTGVVEILPLDTLGRRGAPTP